MSHRGPEPPADSGDGERDYGWLYGAQGSGRVPVDNQHGATTPPDHTQVLPATEPQRARAGGRRRARPTEPAQTPPPPRTPPPAAAARRPRRRRPVRRILITVLVAWLVFLIAVPVWAWSRLDKVDAAPDGDRPGNQPGTTYLLVGSDSRKGLSDEENKKLGTGGVGDVGQRTDTIMLLHTGSGPNVLLSVPRDSIVPIPGHGEGKINAAFAYGGPELLVQTLEDSTGLRIDHYVEIGFGGFVNAVDAVGGVEICPKSRMRDPKANLNIKKGCQEVDGATALGYARSRKFASGDIERAQHQREVVAAIGAEVKSPMTVLNPLRYFRVAGAGASSFKISEGTGPLALGGFALGMTRVDGENGRTCSMPIRDLAVHWDRERALELLKLLKDDNTDEIPDNLCNANGLAQ